jgi:hypothetical protein
MSHDATLEEVSRTDCPSGVICPHHTVLYNELAGGKTMKAAIANMLRDLYERYPQAQSEMNHEHIIDILQQTLFISEKTARALDSEYRELAEI